MTFSKYFRFLLLVLLILSGMGCGDIRPIWKGEKQLRDKGYTLYFSEPCEFSIDLNDLNVPVNARLELAITYYVKISRTNLPLYLVLEDEKHVRREFFTNVLIKDDGEWLGAPDEDNVDYTITHLAISEIELEKGIYSLKIYSDDQDFEQIEGVVKIAARLFEVSEEDE
ncbi:MAG: hypothetical protein MRZ79_09930 [Bacteroidia bacterium]|nr:hypothetical protein [Bacteroidia bacterium]